MSFKLGMECKLYANTGTFASPTWAERSNVKDVTLGLEKGEADVTTRANNGWRATVGTLKDASLEFEMMWDPAEDFFGEVRDAFLNSTNLDLAVMSEDITTSGSEGLHAEWQVLSFTRNEPLEEAVTVSVTMKPAYSSNAPEWLEI